LQLNKFHFSFLQALLPFALLGDTRLRGEDSKAGIASFEANQALFSFSTSFGIKACTFKRFLPAQERQ
jgi:hypothetical protein